jgi:hypothetical protein
MMIVIMMLLIIIIIIFITMIMKVVVVKMMMIIMMMVMIMKLTLAFFTENDPNWSSDHPDCRRCMCSGSRPSAPHRWAVYTRMGLLPGIKFKGNLRTLEVFLPVRLRYLSRGK